MNFLPGWRNGNARHALGRRLGTGDHTYGEGETLGARSFFAGFAVATVLALGGGIWLLLKLDKVPITYPPPTFYDSRTEQGDAGYVTASGVLLGDNMDGRTYLKVTCLRESGECRVLELSQARSPKMVLENQDVWKISSWEPETIKAVSDPMLGTCNRVEFTIYRTNEEAVYTRIPSPNADKETCKALSKKTFTWKLGPQPIG